MTLFPHSWWPRSWSKRSKTPGGQRRGRRVRAPEALEARVNLSTALTTLEFDIPADVANLGVQLAIFGTNPQASGSDPSGPVYLDETSPNVYAYKGVPNQGSGIDPMITLTSPSKSNTKDFVKTVTLPSDQLNAGEAVMFVGPNSGLSISTSTGQYEVPTVSSNPNQVFSLFELSYLTSGSTSNLDVDISSIDQLGFTYTVSTVPSSAAPYPLATVGTTPTRSDLFDLYKQDSNPEGPFRESLTLGQDASGNQLRLVAPQTILSTVEKDGPTIVSAVPPKGATGSTQPLTYYYEITATSKNADGTHGESIASPNYVSSGSTDEGVTLTWDAYTGIQSGDPTDVKPVSGSSATKGYNIYRAVESGATQPQPGDFQWIHWVGGAGTTTFTDHDDATKPVSPPANSYGFDPLSTYFTGAIENFFEYYSNSTFTYDQLPQIPGQNGTTWTGKVHNLSIGSDPTKYTVLVLTSDASSPFSGKTLYVYDPLFSTNTKGITGLTSMPSWMTGNEQTSPEESPSEMIFGCDGVFATNAYDPTVADVAGLRKALGNIENVIVSAFNRGLAALPNIPSPDQWTNPIQFTQDPEPSHTPDGMLQPDQTYDYVVTAKLASGETVPTREVSATLSPGQNAVTLHWDVTSLPASDIVGYNIYRSTKAGEEVLVDDTVPADALSYLDKGIPQGSVSPTAPPLQFYSSSTYNGYSAFLHKNSTTDPDGGVSVNGLAYGYPFDDDGSFSTNIEYGKTIPTKVVFDLQPWDDSTTLEIQAPTAATPGVPFNVTVEAETATGAVDPSFDGVVHFSSSDASAGLPADYTFTAADGGKHTFAVTLDTPGAQSVTASGGTDTAPATATVDVGTTPTPSTTTTTELSVTPNPAVAGQPVTLTATVTAASGAASPSGSVVFRVDGVAQPAVPLGSVHSEADAAASAGATLVMTSLSPGNHTITASYLGSTADAASGSAGVALAVAAGPAPDPTGPIVTSVTRFGYHAQPTTLVVQFDEPLAAGPAQNAANYRITGPLGRAVPVKQVVYNPTTNSVTLAPAGRLNLHAVYQFEVVGTAPQGIESSAGVFLDGAGTGQPGTDYVTRLSAANLVLGSSVPGGPSRLANLTRKVAGIARRESAALAARSPVHAQAASVAHLPGRRG